MPLLKTPRCVTEDALSKNTSREETTMGTPGFNCKHQPQASWDGEVISPGSVSFQVAEDSSLQYAWCEVATGLHYGWLPFKSVQDLGIYTFYCVIQGSPGTRCKAVMQTAIRGGRASCAHTLRMAVSETHKHSPDRPCLVHAVPMSQH